MPHALKPYKIDFVIHPGTRQTLDIFLDRDKKVFFASIGMHRVEHSDANEIKKLALDLLMTVPVYEWKPIISIDRVDEENTHHRFRQQRYTERVDIEFRFTFYRCEITKDPLYKGPETRWDPKEIWYERKHATDFEATIAELDKRYVDEKRAERDANRNLDRHHSADGVRILPYNETTWNALHRIHGVLMTARTQLAMLIDTKDLEARLLSVQAVPMLPPPTAQKKRKS